MTTKVSVIMPVYNGERYIEASIRSILEQTYKDFELIIVNDGSSDRTEEIIKKIKDPRIAYTVHSKNLGLARARNTGLSLTRSKYIAWLDSDDISHQRRIEKQVKLLDINKKVGLCGTWVQTIGEHTGIVWKYPTSSDTVRCRMLFDDPLTTSAVMMRKECLDGGIKGFDPDYPPAEDYDLWEKISQNWDVANIPEVLTYYRFHPAQTSPTMAKKQVNAVWKIQRRILKKLVVVATENEKKLHLDIGVGWCFKPNLDRLKDTENWLLKLYYANRKNHIFPSTSFKQVLGDRYYMAYCAFVKNQEFNEQAWKIFRNSKICRWNSRMVLRLMKNILKSL